jgi:hypothetical protein
VNPPALAFEVSHPERVQTSYVRYLRRQAYEFFPLAGAPLRIWFRSRFKLRSDEELHQYLAWGGPAREAAEEWIDEEAKHLEGAEAEQEALDAEGEGEPGGFEAGPAPEALAVPAGAVRPREAAASVAPVLRKVPGRLGRRKG